MTDLENLILEWSALRILGHSRNKKQNRRMKKLKKVLDTYDLLSFLNHTDTTIRTQLSYLIHEKYLHLLMNDKSKFVRAVTAQRIDNKELYKLMNDEDECVRIEVAKRIDKENAILMWAIDPSKDVRDTAKDNVLKV
jgi:hypothetical protein